MEDLQLEINALRERIQELEGRGEGPFRLLFQLSPDASILLDGDLFVDCNEAAMRMMGATKREEILGRHPVDLSPERQPDGRRSSEKAGEMIAAARKQGSHRFEWLHRRSDGTELPVEVILTAVPVGGRLMIHTLLRDMTEQKKAEDKLRKSYQRSFQRLQKAMEGTVEAMARVVETRDPYTAGHQNRVAELAKAIAQEMKLFEDQRQCVYMAAVIHDIGKIYIPHEILSKPARLSPLEMNFIRTHPQAGYDIIKNVDFQYPVAQTILEHHERLNGSGYPRGVLGKGILLEARIIAVADVVEAMVSHRPYRPSLSVDEALGEITQMSDILYDRTVAAACVKVFRDNGFQFG